MCRRGLSPDSLRKASGNSPIVDNRPGAGSTWGADLVAKAAPDGHTLLVTHNAIAINQSLYAKLPCDTVRDFTPVAFIGITTFTLVVNPALAAKGRSSGFCVSSSLSDLS